MIIGIDASRANRPEKTGVEWYAYNLIESMKRLPLAGARVDLYANVPLTGDLAAFPRGWNERVLHWFPRRIWTQGRLSLEMMTRPPDVLFIPSHVIPIIPPRRVVMTIHDIGFERRPELYPAWERTYHRLMMRHALRVAAHFIAVSEFTKADMIDVYGIPENKITVIHHGFYGSSKAGTSGALPELLLNKPYLLFVGRIEAKKNLVTLIRAFDIVKTRGRINGLTQLVMVGKKGFRADDVDSAIRTSLNARDIHLLNWTPTEALHALYAHAALYCFPSLYEGFGFPVLEAMSWGIPTIVSDIPAHREIAGDAALIVAPTAEAFADGIERMMGDAPLAEQYIERGKARTQRFSWTTAAERTLTLLQNTIQ